MTGHTDRRLLRRVLIAGAMLAATVFGALVAAPARPPAPVYAPPAFSQRQVIGQPQPLTPMQVAPGSQPQLPGPPPPLPPLPGSPATRVASATSAAQPPAAPRRESGSLIFDGVPLPDPQLEARLAHYLQSRGATFLDWMADGSLLISTRFGETEQVHRVEAPLGQREQLTFYPDAIEWARAAKSGTGFAFL